MTITRCITLLLLSAICFLFLGTAGVLSAQDAATREGRIKAACIYHLSQFIEWPSDSADQRSDNFTVCTLGEDTALPFIEATLKKKKKLGAPYRIISISPSSTSLATCDLLYWGKSETNSLATPLSELSATLSVSATGNPELNTDVRLDTKSNKLGIFVKQQRITDRNFKVSSELLSIATIEE